MSRMLVRVVPVLSLAFVTALFVGCSKEKSFKPPAPLAPETELTYAPLQGDTAGYRVHLFWNGYDSDGEVVSFRYAIDGDTSETDKSKWKQTTAKDTTLLLLVDPVKEIRGHVFWVSSEDNSGQIDPTPAKRFFSTKTIPPFSKILRGPSAFNSLIGPNFTFEWEGTDPDGGETGGKSPCDSFEYLLLLVGTKNDATHPVLPAWTALPNAYISQTNTTVGLINRSTGDCVIPPYDDWCWTGIHAKKVRVKNATPGEYVFALRAVDLAGAREKNLKFIDNVRHFTSSNRNPGPQLVVRANVLNQPLPTATGPTDFPRREIQIFEGEVISFAWTANADAYGGDIVGFTYALDDTASFPSIDARNMGVTYFPDDLTIGLHFLFVRVLDDGGLITNAVIPFRIVHPTFKDPPSASSPPQFLYVDDTLNPTRFFNIPSDIQEDDWWRVNILTPLSLEFGMGRRDWDTAGVGAAQGGTARVAPTPSDLAPYRVVVWNVDGNNSIGNNNGLWQTLVGGAYSDLGGYLRAGGTMVLSGSSIATVTVNPVTALTQNESRGICFTYAPGTTGFGGTFFPRTMMGLDAAREATAALRTQGANDFVEGRVTTQGASFGYTTAQVDTGATAKWSAYVFAGPPDQSLAPGLPEIQGWRMATFFNCEPTQGIFRRENPSISISTPIYTYHGVRVGIAMNGAQSPREGWVCGVQVQAHDLGGFGGGLLTPGNAQGAVGRMVVLGFPIYFLKDPQAVSVMHTAFQYVNGSPTLPAIP